MNERIDQIIAEMSEQDVALAIAQNDCDWLAEACAYAAKTGDWLYVQTQWNKHAPPLIREVAEGKYESETASNNAEGYYSGCEAGGFGSRSLFTPIRGQLNPVNQSDED